jgi:hypothetical protein
MSWIEHHAVARGGPRSDAFIANVLNGNGLLADQPPAQACVELLGAINVRDRGDHDLQLQVSCGSTCSLDCRLIARLVSLHVEFLTLWHRPSVMIA